MRLVKKLAEISGLDLLFFRILDAEKADTKE